jgi:hypothetical protein
MLQDPEFDSKDVEPDLHKRMDKAVLDGRIKCFNMRESDANGYQDLNLWARELEDAVREIMKDPISYSRATRILSLNWIWMRWEGGCLGGRPMLGWRSRLAN